MARLWSSGFELQSATSGVEWDTTTGSPTINTTTFRSGLAALRANPTATTAFIKHKTNNSGNRIYYRFYLYITTSTGSLQTIARLWNANDATGVSIRLNSNRTLEFWDDSGPSQIGSDSSALNTSQWYRIELDMQTDADAVHAKIDGTQFATASGLSGIIGAPDTVYLGAVTSQTSDLYFDDIAVNDTAAGTGQTAFPGAGSIVHMQPTATGDNSGGTYTGAATGWQTLSEVTPDDATTYTALTVINTDILDVNCESSSNAGIGSGDTVSLVQVGMRLSATSAASCSITPRIKSASGGTTTSGTATAVAVTAWNTHDDTSPKTYKLTSYTDPTTAAAWTPTGTNSLDNMQIGILSTDVTPNPLVSTLWALVEYIPSAATNVTVSDSVTVTESVATTLVFNVNVSDSVTVTENVATTLAFNKAVSDSITITEAVTAQQNFNITVNDSVTVSESVVLAPVTNVAVSDGVAVTESVQVQPPGAITVSDSITVSESATEQVLSFVNVNDSVTLTENVNVTAVFNATVTAGIQDIPGPRVV